MQCTHLKGSLTSMWTIVYQYDAPLVLTGSIRDISSDEDMELKQKDEEPT